MAQIYQFFFLLNHVFQICTSQDTGQEMHINTNTIQLTEHSFQAIEARLPLGENWGVQYSLDCSVIGWTQCRMKMQGTLFQSKGKDTY